MLNQKKLSLLIAAGLVVSLSAFPVFADDAPAPPASDAPAAHHEGKPHMNIFDRLETMLKLTDDQKTTIDPILQDAKTQIQGIEKNKDLKPEDKKAQRLAVIDGLPDKLNPTLDETQKATLAKFIERMKNPPEHHEGGPRGQHGDHPQPQGGDQPKQDMPGQDG